MNKRRINQRNSWKSLTPAHRLDGRSGYLMREEEYILQSMSMRAPLRHVLNGICGALDCQIGSVVSFISLPWDEDCELSEIAMKAAAFGLFAFCTRLVFSEANQHLGFFEMYSLSLI